MYQIEWLISLPPFSLHKLVFQYVYKLNDLKEDIMSEYIRPVQIRWSDLDPNFHLRHSVYYDWGAFVRIEYLYEHELTGDVMQQLGVGPIIFREESVFRKEIRLGDSITIDLKLLKAKRDFSRWSIQHQIKKNDDILSATLTVEGAWLDTAKRKLAVPPQKVNEVFNSMPKAEDFEWIDKL